MTDEPRHIWHTATPDPGAEPTTGKRLLALAFLLLVTVVVIGALVLVLGGYFTTGDVDGPGTR